MIHPPIIAGTRHNGIFNTYSLLLSGFGMITFLCVILFIATHSYYPLIVPLSLIVGFAIFSFPLVTIFLYIIAFYLGAHLFEKWGFFYIDMPHLVIPLIFLGYFSRYLSTPRPLPDAILFPKSIIRVLLLFLFSAFFSFILTIGIHTRLQNLLSLWYLFNLGLLALAICFFSQQWVKNLKKKIITLVISLSVMEIPVIISQIVHLKDNSILMLQNVTGTFTTHHAMLANMMTFPLGFSLYRMLDESRLKFKILYGFLAFTFLDLIIFSSSRSNLIGIFCAGIIVVIMRMRPKPIHIVYMVFIVLMAGLLIQLSPLHHIISGTLRSRETGSLDLSSLVRLYIWKGSLEHFWKAPILGKIFGTGMANFGTIQFSSFIFTIKHASGAHNNFLHVLMETGICGLVLFMTYFIMVLIKLFKQSKNDRLALAYFFITLALLMSGFTQETFWFQPAFGLLWLFHVSLLAIILDAPRTNHPRG
jgi:O-antigen ligase